MVWFVGRFANRPTTGWMDHRVSFLINELFRCERCHPLSPEGSVEPYGRGVSFLGCGHCWRCGVSDGADLERSRVFATRFDLVDRGAVRRRRARCF